MKKHLKTIIAFVIVLLVAMQFIPSSKNTDTTIAPTDFLSIYSPPDSLATYFKSACYDCHSNNTKYPWYNKIQPVALLIENHISEAKGEINLSEFGLASKEKQDHYLHEMIEEIEKDGMPLAAYTLMHKEANLSQIQKEQLLNWLKSL